MLVPTCVCLYNSNYGRGGSEFIRRGGNKGEVGGGGGDVEIM